MDSAQRMKFEVSLRLSGLLAFSVLALLWNPLPETCFSQTVPPIYNLGSQVEGKLETPAANQLTPALKNQHPVTLQESALQVLQEPRAGSVPATSVLQTKNVGSQTGSTMTQEIGQAGLTQAGLTQATRVSQFDGEAAFEHLKAICKFGPRVSASVGMRKQQKYIEKHFKELGAKRHNQPFNVRSPYTGKFVKLHNMIVQFHPERKKRLLICCHHDTRPFPDADPINPRGKFIGANDGASGVALLCELGKHMQGLEGQFGVDFIFFDGEEFVIQRQRDPMFLGSTHFSNEYVAGRVGWKYEYGLLVDMVADKDLQIYFEGNSLGFADGLTRSVWTVAKDLGVKEFIPQKKHQIRDDHLPLNSIAGIRTVDIIDFDYPNPAAGNQYWHTQKDSVENCSAESVGKVGKVVLEWLRQVQKLNKAK